MIKKKKKRDNKQRNMKKNKQEKKSQKTRITQKLPGLTQWWPTQISGQRKSTLTHWSAIPIPTTTKSRADALIGNSTPNRKQHDKTNLRNWHTDRQLHSRAQTHPELMHGWAIPRPAEPEKSNKNKTPDTFKTTSNNHKENIQTQKIQMTTISKQKQTKTLELILGEGGDSSKLVSLGWVSPTISKHVCKGNYSPQTEIQI